MRLLIAEDVGVHSRPVIRLSAITLSSLFCALLFPSVLHSLGVNWLDTLLAYYPIALVFTVFAATGVINAFSLIDGLHGLASVTAITSACALVALALMSNLEHFVYFYLILAIATFGFFVVNFPFGKLFLGDGGAYLLGCCLVFWGGITLANQVVGLSPFAILLIFFWSVADTMLAIWRRFSLSAPTGRPDRLHFHQLVMRFLEIRILGRSRRSLANPLATIIMVPFIVIPQICGLIFAFNHSTAVASSVAFSFMFFTTYMLGMYLAKRSSVQRRIKVQKKLDIK
jgi:UDP-N-acetylmuramyl pentapeptide phosphotransferase/UDP-N-acetylglucosamine-1-phosphate transferase